MISTATTTCSRDTARCSDARSYEHALRACCRTHLIAITRHVVGSLQGAGIPYWADYGTLLGAVRNPMTTWADYPWLEGTGPIRPGIIPHDKDADIGVLHSYWAVAWRVVRRVAMTLNYDIVGRPERGSIKVRLSKTNHTNLDIFFWSEKPNGIVYRRQYAAVDAFKGKHFHRDLLLPLGTVEWEGMKLSAPRDPEAFLAMRFGENWRTPVMANNDAVRR